MKKLVILSAILATAAAGYSRVNSWGFPELENIVHSGDVHVEPTMMQCLNVAYSFYLKEMKEEKSKKEPLSPPSLTTHRELKAIVPSPQGKNYWEPDDLMSASIRIVDNMRLDDSIRPSARHHMRLNFQELNDALEIITPSTGKVKSTDELINIEILRALHNVMTEVQKNNTILLLRYKIKIPMLDVSIWTAEDLYRVLKKPDFHPKVIPYLKAVLLEPLHFLDDGEKFCVVTPVNVLPARKPDYYVPNATKRLLSELKYKSMRKLWPSQLTGFAH